jgi:hypothetical protein
MKPIASLTALAAAVFTVGCLSRPASTASIRPAPEATPQVRAAITPAPKPFAWAGTFDVIGDGFPDGMRSAIITITPRDTVFDFFIEGPPGTLMSSMFAGDSLHVVWDMLGVPMYVDLRGAADSLDGQWRMADRGGRIWGTRRR